MKAAAQLQRIGENRQLLGRFGHRTPLSEIRYYEKIGLLPEPPRTASGYRGYDAAHERRLRFM